MNDNFLINVEYNSAAGAYVASFADGQNISLSANNYTDAILEADMLDVKNYELGYN
jgi:hypothetical protein